jgi:hypothetical protein
LGAAGDWYLESHAVQAPAPDNRCGIYHRPQICRDYGWPDAENPEALRVLRGDGGYDLYFETAEAFDAWSRSSSPERRAGPAPGEKASHEGRPSAVAGLAVLDAGRARR